MKKRLLLALLAFCWVTSSYGQVPDARKGVVFSQDRRREVSLNGEWRFRFEPGQDADDHCLGKEFDDSGWDFIPVPGCWDALGYTEPRYTSPIRSTGIYRRDFDVPAGWLKGGRVFLRFDGVLKGYEVWVNGEKAGQWESAYNSCHFDVTDFLNPGRNLLAVKVYTEFKGSDFDSNDDWGQAGIDRTVSIFPVPDFHISDITVRTTGVSEDKAVLEYAVETASFASAENAGRVRVIVRGPSGRRMLSKRIKVMDGAVEGSVELKRPALWSAETPQLYTFECRAGRKDRQRLNFGIREVLVDGAVLKLNGRPVKLRGVDFHDTDPLLGKYITRERLLQDLTMMKQANINFIRCSHYPKAPEFYDLCDSLGFYVMDEVPFGFGDHHLRDSSYQDILLTRAEATVSRDKNHACVIVWSVGNENPLTPIAEETGRYVKAADPSRPICYPMIHDYFLSLNYNIPSFVDIFAPHYPPVSTLLGYAATAERPVIATEYCHSLGQSLEQMDELWEIMQASPNLAGGAVWEWCDQGMPDVGAEFPGRFARTDRLWLRDSTCIKMEGNSGTDGIIYADRTPLSNYYELRANYAQARLLTDSLLVSQGMNKVDLTLENRYDFIDLASDVKFRWALKEGATVLQEGGFSVQCAPGCSVSESIGLNVPGDPGRKAYSLSLQAVSGHWGTIGEYEIPVMDQEGCSGLDLVDIAAGSGLADAGDSLPDLPEMFLRAGRKKGLAESIRARKALTHYLLRPEWGKDGSVRFKNDEFEAAGRVEMVPQGNGAVRVEAEIVPKTEGAMLLEGGLAFLLDENVKYVQWLGKGPYATYPGKNRANRYGVHGMTVDDLYFDGNRMGVRAVLATDERGCGWLVTGSCADGRLDAGNVNFEYTDAGLVLSINDKVSGLCGKLRPTSFPVLSSADDPIRVSFVIVPVGGFDEWPAALRGLFVSPSEIPVFNPFLTQYDTFNLPLSEILGVTNQGVRPLD